MPVTRMTFADLWNHPGFQAMVLDAERREREQHAVFCAWLRGGHRAAARQIRRHHERDAEPWRDLGGEA